MSSRWWPVSAMRRPQFGPECSDPLGPRGPAQCMCFSAEGAAVIFKGNICNTAGWNTIENSFHSLMLMPPSLEYITMPVLCPEEDGFVTGWIAMCMSGPLYVTTGQMQRQVSVAPSRRHPLALLKQNKQTRHSAQSQVPPSAYKQWRP